MSDVIISVENLGKKYSLRHNQPERYTALRDLIARKPSSLQFLVTRTGASLSPSVDETLGG